MATLVRYERGTPKGQMPYRDIKGSYVIINRTAGTVAAFNANGTRVWPERKLDIRGGEEAEHLRSGMWYIGDTSQVLPEGF